MMLVCIARDSSWFEIVGIEELLRISPDFIGLQKAKILGSEKKFLTLYISKHKYYERSRLCIYPYQSKFQG